MLPPPTGDRRVVPTLSFSTALGAALGTAFGTLADLVLPRRCAGCDGAGAAVCPRCAATLAGPPFLAVPGRLATPGRRPLACMAAAGYDGPARALLLAFKERGRLDLARPLGTALARAVAAAVAPGGPCGSGRPPPAILLVPVPANPVARRRRGFDHVTRLAVVAAGLLRSDGCRVEVAPLLRPARRVADQSGLGARERASNLRGAFVAARPGRWLPAPGGSPRPGRPSAAPWSLVVDDVVTTGETLAEAARALRAAGVPVGGAATVLATPARYPTRRTVRLPASGVPEG